MLYSLLKPDKVMLVDISKLNAMPVNDDWYNFDIRTNGYPSNTEIDQFLGGVDTVFMCESPLNYYLLSRAAELGIRTVTQVNPEFLDYFSTPELPQPTVTALPSTWMEADIRATMTSSEVVHLPVPVDVTHLPKRHVTEAKTFFHIAGRPAYGDRNGTHDFIQAARLAGKIEPGISFILYCQQPTRDITAAVATTRIELVSHVDDYAELYARGDVLVLPRKYGGLCLPAQEAVGAGIPVLMPDISPNNAWLPSEWLLRVNPEPKVFKPRGTVHMWDTDVTKMAQRMLDLYRSPSEVEIMAKQAKELGESLSWEVLKARYKEVLYQDA